MPNAQPTLHRSWSDSNIRIPAPHALMRMLESKGPLANISASGALDLTFASRASGRWVANVKCAPLVPAPAALRKQPMGDHLLQDRPFDRPVGHRLIAPPPAVLVHGF